MQRRKIAAVLALLLTLAVGALVAVPQTSAAGCPFSNLICTDQYDPVICADGKVYSNACYAMRACAVGCVPYRPAS